MELDRGTYSEGAVRSEGIFLIPTSHYTSSPLFSPYPSFSLSPSPSLSISCGFCLDWVLTDVKNDFADCNLMR